MNQQPPVEWLASRVPQVPGQLAERMCVSAASLQRMGGGVSGSPLWRGRTRHASEDDRVFKAHLLERFTGPRIEAIHRLSNLGAGMVELQVIDPASRLPTAWIDGAWVWQCQRWVDGCPLDASASIDPIVAGVRMIGRFQASVAAVPCDFGTGNMPLAALSRVPTAMDDRIDRLVKVLADPAAITRAAMQLRAVAGLPPDLADPLGRVVRDARRHWQRLLCELREVKNAMPSRRQWCLRDVHRENMLFETPGFETLGLETLDDAQATIRDPKATIIDPDGCRWDDPAIDIARWVGSFAITDLGIDAWWPAVLAGWRDAWPSNVQATGSRRRISCLMETTAWMSLLFWLDQVPVPAGVSSGLPAGASSSTPTTAAANYQSKIDFWARRVLGFVRLAKH
ncbi:MAG: hypothetical protein AAF958_09085 [Planctomycetota bacterium]